VRRTLYLGIDPGKQGAAVLLHPDGSVAAWAKLPILGKDLDLHALSTWLEAVCIREGCTVDSISGVLEALGSRPAARMGATSAITMGRNWGRLEGLLCGLGLRYDIARPKVWQKLICPGSADPKVRSISACRRLFPTLDLTPGRKVKPDDNIADAACIAEYCRRVLGEGR
tara:strand:+ start:3281 stop:3790 length:510 start_codon:yes stop_codon:yes gene_type:complete